MLSVTGFEFDFHVDPDFGPSCVLCVLCVWCKETPLDRLIECCSCFLLNRDLRHSLHHCEPAFRHITIEMKIEERMKMKRNESKMIRLKMKME
jgi:hypothetical protein